MPIVHAHKRTKPTPIEVGGLALVFKPNEQGECICEVPEGEALARLLAIPEAFRLHGQEQTEDDDENEDTDSDPGPASRYVLTNGDETVDLRTMSDEQLHAFAAENDVKVSPKAKGDTIRNKIVEAFSAAD